MTSLEHSYLHAIFCDDVRHEASGKMLYIGVYNGELIAPAYPVLLPKMVLIAHYGPPLDQVGRSNGKAQSLSLVLDNEVLLEVDQSNDSASQLPEGGTRSRLLTFMMALAPLQLARPGRLRINIKRDDGSELLSNSLNCRLPTDAEQAASVEEALTPPRLHQP